jgi:hypothetical protein
MDLWEIADKILIPAGITTYSLLVITLLLGLFRKKLGAKFRFHLLLGKITAVSATVHLACILYTQFGG